MIFVFVDHLNRCRKSSLLAHKYISTQKIHENLNSIQLQGRIGAIFFGGGGGLGVYKHPQNKSYTIEQPLLGPHLFNTHLRHKENIVVGFAHPFSKMFCMHLLQQTNHFQQQSYSIKANVRLSITFWGKRDFLGP